MIFQKIRFFYPKGGPKKSRNFFMLEDTPCAIDSPYKITTRWMLSEENRYFSIFASIYQNHSLNQGQRSVFMLWECAQSILRIFPIRRAEKNKRSPLFFADSGYCIEAKWSKFEFFPFSLQYNILNQGQEGIYKVQKCAQSISRTKLPLETIISKKS